MSDFDVLVVGAGPAGSFAAERLASAGASVALFDGRPDGQAKACGGGVTAKALKAWPHLLDAVGRTIHELDMYAPSGRGLHLKLDEPFAVYSRRAFDSYLLQRALAAGAQVFPEKVSSSRISKTRTGWVVKAADGSERSGKILVGADGANSAIARKLAGPLPPAEMEVAFGYRTPLPTSGAAPTVVAFLPAWIGYAWAFPRLDHISFGIATAQDAFEHEPLDKLLWDFMIGYYRVLKDSKAKLWISRVQDRERDVRVREQLSETAERYAARIPGLAPQTWDTRRACGGNASPDAGHSEPAWALLGDAAGFADPVTGEGIYYALRSAELFAESYLAGKPLAYEQRWRQDFGRELQRASEMRQRFYGNFWGAPFTERMIKFARGHRGIKRVLGDLVAGQQGYVDLKRKLARKALRPI
jgi:flavin-dependent dehydrogenase